MSVSAPPRLCWDCRHPLRIHEGGGCRRCECVWSEDEITTITKPPAHRLAMIEVAARGFNRRTTTTALNYARHVEPAEKQEGRRRLLRLWNRAAWPKGLAILTLPSSHWKFEWALLQSRELKSTIRGSLPAKRTDFIHLNTKRTFVTAVERDPSIYLAALKMIPGGKQGIAQVDSAAYASRSLKTPLVARFHLASVERLLLMEDHAHDAVWLDFNGPLTDARTEGIRRFWREGLVRTHLAVSILAARQSVAYDAGRAAEFMRSLCPGSELVDAFHYQSGRSPMSQIVIGRAS